MCRGELCSQESVWVEGNCLCQWKQESRAGGRQPGPLSFGSLLLSWVTLPQDKNQEEMGDKIVGYFYCFFYLFGKGEVKG